MADLHQKAIKSALKTVKDLGKLSDKLRSGNSEIHRAYRTVIRALEGNTTNAWIVAEALTTLKASVELISANYYGDAIAVGIGQVKRDLKIYGLGELEPIDENTAGPALASTMALVELQADRTTSVAMLDLGEEYILGDDDRKGILTESPVIGEMAFWLTVLAILTYEAGISDKMDEGEEIIIEVPVEEVAEEDVAEKKEKETKEINTKVVRQAVAQVDSDTTRTCLNVHGQIVGLNKKFHLTGTPRYADDMHKPPFHRGCRTAIATILEEYLKDEVTAGMRKDAVEQGKKPKPSALKGKAHYKVVGKKVREFRKGQWHSYKTYDTNVKAREAAAKLNRDRRS